MTRLLTLLGSLVWGMGAVFFVWFAANNTAPVLLLFSPFSFSLAVPPWLLLFAGIFIGLIVAMVATSWRRLRAFVQNRQLRRERDRLTSEVATLSEEAHNRAAGDAHVILTQASLEPATLGAASKKQAGKQVGKQARAK